MGNENISRRTLQGFTLTEMSFVLVIVGVIVGSSLMVGQQQITQQQVVRTYSELKQIDNHLKLFAQRHGRLPCPARMDAADDDAEYGRQATDCADSSPPSGITRVEYPGGSNIFVRIGTVPFKALGLSDDFIADDWGNRYLYAVTEDMITAISESTEGTILVQDSGGNTITDNGAYALVSHGPTEKGGTSTDTQTVFDACDAANRDGENCNGDGIFIDQRINDGEVAASFFDDYVIWRNRMNILEEKPIAYREFYTGEEEDEDDETANSCNGMGFNAGTAGERAGWSVANAGDVNGDGKDDIVIGAPDASGGAGKVYVVFGTTDRATVTLSALDGTDGFVLTGAAAGDKAGYSVAGNIDANGDGIDDIIIGAPYNDAANSNAGSTYIVFGKTTAWAASIALSTLDGTTGTRLTGINANDNSGITVSGIGNFNNDSYGDILIGAPYADPNGGDSGQAYVVYGRASWPASFAITSMTPLQGKILNGSAASNWAGYSVSTGGDVNGDGMDDAIIGAPLTDFSSNNAGSAYVFFGNTSTASLSLNLSALNGTNGTRLDGPASASWTGWAGEGVAGGGDINGDGFADMLITVARMHTGGAVYAVFGKGSWAATFALSGVNGTTGVVLSNGIDPANWENWVDYYGLGVSNAGDINNDGFDDILIGLKEDDALGVAGNLNNSGSTVVVLGKASGWAAAVDTTTALNGGNGFLILDNDADDQAGYGVGGGGDFDGDGFDDLIIGVPYGDPGGASAAGEAYLFFGQDDDFNALYNVQDLPQEACDAQGNLLCDGGLDPQENDGSCYTYFNICGSWNCSRNMCRAWGGDLTIIGDATENTWLAAYIDATPCCNKFWIGLEDLTTPGSFTWVDGTPISYTSWYASYPSGSNTAVLMERSGNGWWQNISAAAGDKLALCERRDEQ